MNPDYDKVIEFFSEHETAIYGFGPTDDGAEEGTLLWCIKELDNMFDINVSIDKRDEAVKQRTLKVLCALIDIYENSSNDAKAKINGETKSVSEKEPQEHSEKYWNHNIEYADQDMDDEHPIYTEAGYLRKGED